MIRRRRFADLIERQLDLFAREDRALLADVDEAKAAYDRAARDEAEEAYGVYVDAVDTVRDALVEMRNRFAVTVHGSVADDYEASFERAARKRWRWL